MADAGIADVRRFNRTVTERLGVLRDRFLGLARPLGEARLLWEIGDEGCELRALRARLGLDSGYLSRSIRSLENAGLITVAPSAADRRSRVASLTAKGKRERALLDQRSDELAQSLLEPLNARQQERLIEAMTTVERLLTASLVDVRVVDPEHPDAQRCLAAYFSELESRSGTVLDPATRAAAKPHEMRPPQGVMLVAYLRGDAIGCGAVKLHGKQPAEIKRMWVADEARGLGLGRRLLAELEATAHAAGAEVAHIETNHTLIEAIALYRSAGWADVAPFNEEPFADHWFEKRFSS
jgi:DNA-binding MarR family transcriptional regulator/ribosomal protein S18 acetylase RimI-like enzyme